ISAVQRWSAANERLADRTSWNSGKAEVMPVRYTDRAAEELLNAVLWYESVQQGLGATMLQLVEDSLERISQRPELYSLKHKHSPLLPYKPFSLQCVLHRRV